MVHLRKGDFGRPSMREVLALDLTCTVSRDRSTLSYAAQFCLDQEDEGEIIINFCLSAI